MPNHQRPLISNSSQPDSPLPDDVVSLSNVTLSGLLPQTEFYLTYEGSLTWPACFETVTWILMNKPIYITVQQVRGIRAKDE